RQCLARDAARQRDAAGVDALRSEQMPEVLRKHDRFDLLEGALPRRFVGAEAHEPGAVTEAVAGDLVIAHLGHELGLQWLPFARALSVPAARSSGRLAGEAGRRDQRLELFGQHRPLVIGDGRGETYMIELALPIVEAEQERAYVPAARSVSETAD